MKASVALRLEDVKPGDLAGSVAVVVDVLRATSSVAAALAAGCREIVPVLEPDEARGVISIYQPGEALLAGERDGLKLPGFDLGNSPLEYIPAAVAGKTIVLTTSNGTRAIGAVMKATAVLLAALVNGPAVARAVASLHLPVCIVCAGTAGRLAVEDVAAAGLLLEELRAIQGSGNVVMEDEGCLALAFYQSWAGRLGELLAGGRHGRRLVELGCAADISYCSQVGTVNHIPLIFGGRIVARVADELSGNLDQREIVG